MWAKVEWRRKSCPIVKMLGWTLALKLILIKGTIFKKHLEKKCSTKDPPLHGRGITDFLGWDGIKCNLIIRVIVSRKDHCITNFPV